MLSCLHGVHGLALTIAPPAVLYLVDHATACIYMERVEGHSLKTLLRKNSLGDTGGCAACHLIVLSCIVLQLSDMCAGTHGCGEHLLRLAKHRHITPCCVPPCRAGRAASRGGAQHCQAA